MLEHEHIVTFNNYSNTLYTDSSLLFVISLFYSRIAYKMVYCSCDYAFG